MPSPTRCTPTTGNAHARAALAPLAPQSRQQPRAPQPLRARARHHAEPAVARRTQTNKRTHTSKQTNKQTHKQTTAGAGVQAKPNNLTILYSSLDFTSRQVPHRLSMSTATIAATVTTAAAGRFRRLRRATIAAATVASAAASQKSFFVFLRWGRAGLTSRWGCRSNTTGNSCVPHQVFPVWGLGHFLVTVTGATIRHDGLCEKMSETPNRKNLMARFSIPIYIYIYIYIFLPQGVVAASRSVHHHHHQVGRIAGRSDSWSVG